MVDRCNSIRGAMRGNVTNSNTAQRGVFGQREPRVSECGCTPCGNGKECAELKKKLKEVDFSLIDTVLYLDVYPECSAALDYYHKLNAERNMLVEALSKSCNMPLTNYDNTSLDSWEWINTPWPWEASAN